MLFSIYNQLKRSNPRDDGAGPAVNSVNLTNMPGNAPLWETKRSSSVYHYPVLVLASSVPGTGRSALVGYSYDITLHCWNIKLPVKVYHHYLNGSIRPLVICSQKKRRQNYFCVDFRPPIGIDPQNVTDIQIQYLIDLAKSNPEEYLKIKNSLIVQ